MQNNPVTEETEVAANQNLLGRCLGHLVYENKEGTNKVHEPRVRNGQSVKNIHPKGYTTNIDKKKVSCVI